MAYLVTSDTRPGYVNPPNETLIRPHPPLTVSVSLLRQTAVIAFIKV